MTPYRILLLGLFLLLGSMLLVSCSDDALPVDPGNDTHIRDTTSHDFVWSFDTVGRQYSLIRSIAVVAPNNLWVTGQFTTYDSLGNPEPRVAGNVAHWNGEEWTFHGFNSAGRKSWYLMHDAFARNADNIWVSGGGPFQWDGARWITHWYDGFRFGSGVRATWVTEDARFACVVGLRGSIAYYRADDPQFRQVHIPFDEDCLDVKGLEDGTMYVAGASLDPYGGHIYRVHPDRSVEVYCDLGIKHPDCLWFHDGALHFSAERRIYRIDEIKGERDIRFVHQAELFILRADHEQENNVFLMMQRGHFLHWNGSTWKMIRIPYEGEFWAFDLAVRGRDVYFVGFGTGQYCVVAHGRQL